MPDAHLQGKVGDNVSDLLADHGLGTAGMAVGGNIYEGRVAEAIIVIQLVSVGHGIWALGRLLTQGRPGG